MEDIVSNVCSLCAMISDSISGTKKNHKQILGFQMISMVFYAIGSIILKDYNVTVQNAVGMCRNVVAIKNVKNKVIEWGLIILGAVLGIVFNGRGLLGILPVVANLGYSIAVFELRQDVKSLKYVFIANMVIFAIFNGVTSNYVGAISNVVVAAVTCISLIKEK